MRKVVRRNEGMEACMVYQRPVLFPLLRGHSVSQREFHRMKSPLRD